jgi:hypothetical protein
VLDIDRLHVTERECNFRYPAAFWAVVAELEALTGEPGFAKAFPGVRPATRRDIREARKLGLPESMVAFACESQPEHTDYYCCGFETEPAVTAFAVHAVVADWPNFGAFLAWVRRQVAKQRQA